jgi:alkylresorcinol/alkylpyrone synthase
LEDAFDGQEFPESRRVLNRHGNMSSPSILFVLDEYCGKSTPEIGTQLWLTSFGAGFSAYGFNLECVT